MRYSLRTLILAAPLLGLTLAAAVYSCRWLGAHQDTAAAQCFVALMGLDTLAAAFLLVLMFAVDRSSK